MTLHPWPDAKSLLDVEQLDLEREPRVRRDVRAGAARAVAQRRRDDQLALAADLHPHHPLVPPLDDGVAAEDEHERLAALARAVELLAAVGQGADVVHAQ